MSARRTRWHPPPPPTPRILHLPRPHRRHRAARPPPSAKPQPPRRQPEPGRNLGALLAEEKVLFPRSKAVIDSSANKEERRRRVEAPSSGESGGDSGEERWRLEAEILRAECNFLRMEREAAQRKLESNCTRAAAALRSAVQVLVLRREKMSGGARAALVEEIEELEEMLAELQPSKRSGCSHELDRSCRANFDRQASVLRRRLEETAEEKEIREIVLPPKQEDTAAAAEASDRHCRFQEVEMLRKLMEGLSRGMLERVEECGHHLHSATSSATATTTTAAPRTRSGSQDQYHNERQKPMATTEEKGREATMVMRCSCKELVGRITEQVHAETEQWAEMQAMLEQVRQEMEELRSSRDLWQRRAASSELDHRCMHNQMLEWRQRAETSARKVKELKKRMVELRFELQALRAELFSPPRTGFSAGTEIKSLDALKISNRQQKTLEPHKEKEARVLVCRLKNSKESAPRRSPLQEIGNLAQRNRI